MMPLYEGVERVCKQPLFQMYKDSYDVNGGEKMVLDKYFMIVYTFRMNKKVISMAIVAAVISLPAEAVFDIPCNNCYNGPNHVTTSPQPTPKPYIPSYIPAPVLPSFPKSQPVNYTSYTFSVPTNTPQVKGVSIKKPTISAADRKAPDFIHNNTVPAVVDQLFTTVFGRKPNIAESTYWKMRARSDKATQSKLLSTMKYFHANSWTYDTVK